MAVSFVTRAYVQPARLYRSDPPGSTDSAPCIILTTRHPIGTNTTRDVTQNSPWCMLSLNERWVGPCTTISLALKATSRSLFAYTSTMLAQLFPHPTYAEDQSSAYTILTIHCLHRGFTTGAILGLFAPFARTAVTTILRRPSLATPLPWTTRLLSSAAIFSLGGTAFLAVATTGRMWGREKIEWQDRSWRILANKGQNREDDWSLGGMVLGTVGMGIAARRGGGFVTGIPMWRATVAGAAVGSILGTVGHVLTSSDSVEDVEKKVIAGEGPLAPKESF
ncbi:MAG: hypothetical protein Q9166_002285 [cf. Caloplaca sp. 2 TL-2023]